MAARNEGEAVPEAMKKLAQNTGEPQSEAAAAVERERLAKMEKDDLSARLLAIGHRASSRMSPEALRLDHAELLYDDRGQ